jgi:hypothetical protein
MFFEITGDKTIFYEIIAVFFRRNYIFWRRQFLSTVRVLFRKSLVQINRHIPKTFEKLSVHVGPLGALTRTFVYKAGNLLRLFFLFFSRQLKSKEKTLNTVQFSSNDNLICCDKLLTLFFFFTFLPWQTDRYISITDVDIIGCVFLFCCQIEYQIGRFYN